MPTVPTVAEEYAKLQHYIIRAQESSATLAHLVRAQGSSSKDHALADGWIAVSELFKRLNYQVTKLAQGKLQ